MVISSLEFITVHINAEEMQRLKFKGKISDERQRASSNCWIIPIYMHTHKYLYVNIFNPTLAVQAPQ